MLKELLPQIEDGFGKLQQAALPGILQDKQNAWTKGIQNMAGIIETYKSSAAAGQNEALLKAAEDLHSQFEQLVRLIRPVSKEIDSYHQELYRLYHYYTPEYDLEKINSSLAALMVRMEAIEKAPLPARLKTNQTAYQQAVTDLKSSLEQLKKTLQDHAPKDQVTAAIESMHTKYQQLISVCEE
jgi:soluble cytochrome b562